LTTATVSEFVTVRMCDNPDCGGWRKCDRMRLTRRTMALGEWLAPDVSDDQIQRIFRQLLTVAPASDSTGLWHMVPPGTEYTVHKGAASVPDEGIREGVFCTAVYSGPDADLDDILAGSPEWTDELAAERDRAAPDQGRALTPNAIRELQDSLNKVAAKEGYQGKVLVLPEGAAVGNSPKPSVGRIVHWALTGGVCLPAIITAYIENESSLVTLTVFGVNDTEVGKLAALDESNSPVYGTWHWPERV
jgi:hypothetical protein